MSKRGGGWRGESRRHSLASKGVKTKPDSNMARMGESNGRWKGGTSKTYYRKIAGCKPNDGKIVHHIDHNNDNASITNLEVLNNRGISARAKHNKTHPEKGKIGSKYALITSVKLSKDQMKELGLEYDGYSKKPGAKYTDYYYAKGD